METAKPRHFPRPHNLKRLQRRKSKRSQSCYHGEEAKAPPTVKAGKRVRGRRRKTNQKIASLASKDLKERLEGGSRQHGMETEKSLVERNGIQDDRGTETVMEGMEAWLGMGVPLPVTQALSDLGFMSPTEIQRRAIPVAMDTTRDVIGAAETVSCLVSSTIGVLKFVFVAIGIGKKHSHFQFPFSVTSFQTIPGQYHRGRVMM